MSWEIPNSGHQIRVKRTETPQRKNIAHYWNDTSWPKRPHFQRSQESVKDLLSVFEYVIEDMSRAYLKQT